MASNRPRPRRSASRRPAPPAARTRAPRPSETRRPATAGPAPRGFRGGLERASLPLITFMHRAPRWLVGAVPALLLLAGLLAPVPWGPLLLGLVTLFLGWLLALSWPRLGTSARFGRTIIVLVLAAAVVARAGGVL
ncbi:MAG TPA: DUF6703 family protein [Jiangellaceae bacterium]